ncbi:hypothetical protein OROMI_017565 [Orobanche minor]
MLNNKRFSCHENKKHQWSSGRIVPCHGTDPGSIPGWCKKAMMNIASCDGWVCRICQHFLE